MPSKVSTRVCMCIPLFNTIRGHGSYRSKVEKVDQTMDSIREQMDLTNEISDAISNPVGMGNMVDEVNTQSLRRAVAEATLTANFRTSSRPSSRRWSRRNWTTDLLAQTECRYTPLHPPLALQTVANVSRILNDHYPIGCWD